MALDPFGAAAGKTVITAAARPTLSHLRSQIKRRGAEYADLGRLSGTDQELDEALSVLRGEADTLPQTILARLKGLISRRPEVFADDEGHRFIEEDRVIALVKTGARKIFHDQDLAAELNEARAIHSEMFGGGGIYGERLLEDAIRFAVLTLLAHLTPADRLVMEVIQGNHEELLQNLGQIRERLAELRPDTAQAPPNVDSDVLDQAVMGEIRKLQRQRLVHTRKLVDRADNLGRRLEGGLQLASSAAKSAAYRELAVVYARSDQPERAEDWIAKAEALGAEVELERARVALARRDLDTAMRVLRDRDDPVAKSLLLDAIRLRDGDAKQLAYFTENFSSNELTGQGLLVVAIRFAIADRIEEAETLLSHATSQQIAENPVLLFSRARIRIAGAMPSDVASRFVQNDGMIPHQKDLRNDEEGRAKLTRARSDLIELQTHLPDLDSPDLESLVDINLLFLNLLVGNASQREQGYRTLAERLADPEQGVELLPLAVAYDVEVDWSAIRTRLERAEQLGGYDDAQLRAGFALAMKSNSAHEIWQFIDTYRERLLELQDPQTIISIQVEALARMGEIERSRALLDCERASLQSDAISFLETTIAEAEGADSISVRLAQFEDTGSTHDLEILVGVLGKARDERLGDYLTKLWERRRQIEDASRACNAFVDAGRELEAEAFLETLGDTVRQDNHLRTHLAWARQRQGRLLEAMEELKALTVAGVDDHNTRQLTIILAVETGRWSELEPFVQRELAERMNRSAAQLMSAAQIAKAISSPTTIDLVRAALAKEPDDPALNLTGYTIAVGAGLERTSEVNGWFARAIAGSNDDGPVYTQDFDDVVVMIKEARSESERLNELVTTAEVPLFLALEAMRGAQSALILSRMSWNAEETDSRHKSVVPLYAGNRSPPATLSFKSVAIDPLAILVLDYLGLLERALRGFEEVVLPAGTLHSFFEDRAKSSPPQPSRIAQARNIKEHVAAGMLSIENLPPADPAFTDKVGDEFARLYSTAVSRDGFVIDTSPLHLPGNLRVTVDPAPYQDRLVSPVGLASALLSTGVLSQARADELGPQLKGSGEPWPIEPAVVPGRPMFVTNIAVQYLTDAGLVPTLKAYADSITILPEVTKLADLEIETGEASAKIHHGIERVRATLAKAIADGSARVGPTRRAREERASEPVRERGDFGPLMSALTDMGTAEAMVCDDRAMNKYLHFSDRAGHNVPLLTTPDVLSILHQKGLLTDKEHSAAREKLRLGGAGLMPLNPQELVDAVIDSNWEIGPNAELRAIRDSIQLPLARKVIQLPQERLWFKSVSLSIGLAIRRAWQELEDPRLAETAASYLFDLIPDPNAWSERDQSPDRDAWVQDVSRHTLWAIASIFDLPDENVAAYRSWFDSSVAPAAERHDPGVMKAVGQALYNFISGPMVDEVEDA